MRIRCLVIDWNPTSRERILDALNKISAIDVHRADNFRESASAIHSVQPNIVILRCGESVEKEERIFNLIERLKWKCVLIPLLAKPIANLIAFFMCKKFVLDILTENAEESRISEAMKKSFDFLSAEHAHRSYFHGFLGFVGIIPSLRERKILTHSGIGLLQNRSLRLAIDYWRKNPDSQLIGVAFNAFETFTTRPDELIECWDDFDFRPWEYGLYEAQRHYMEYWKAPIQEGLLSNTISVLLREGNDDLTPLNADAVRRILVKVGELTRKGSITEIFETMGISFHDDSKSTPARTYEDFIKVLEKQMNLVDKEHPELTRPPSETGYEDFVPDIATPYQDDSKRMAFLQKNR